MSQQVNYVIAGIVASDGTITLSAQQIAIGTVADLTFQVTTSPNSATWTAKGSGGPLGQMIGASPGGPFRIGQGLIPQVSTSGLTSGDTMSMQVNGIVYLVSEAPPPSPVAPVNTMGLQPVSGISGAIPSIVTLPVPSAGNNYAAATVPGAVAAKMQAFHGTLNCSGTVQNRYLSVLFKDSAGHTFANVNPNISPTANAVADITWGIGLPADAGYTIAPTTYFNLQLPELWLPPAATVTVTAYLAAGDNWSVGYVDFLSI